MLALFWFALTASFSITEPGLTDSPSETSRSNTPLLITVACVVGLIASYVWNSQLPSIASQIVLACFEISAVSIVIWQACDPFADAAQFLGEKWRIPSSVRGATLDAIASSLPELFTGLFFVLVALSASGAEPKQNTVDAGAGFGATIATCAGSAVYNMILIPAFCGITIALTRRTKPVIEIERNVISRDGFWFLVCELVLVAFLFQKQLSWHLAAVLLVLYVIYLFWLWFDARKYRTARSRSIQRLAKVQKPSDELIRKELLQNGIKANPSLIEYVRLELGNNGSGREEVDQVQSAGVLFGRFDISLRPGVAYAVLGISTLITAAACYWLVEVTMNIADTLSVPVFFVAVIVAAAASSVPDTLISIAAAKRGDDDGAVSNAFGSNIFDICVCLALPLITGIYLNGGKPIALTVDGQPMPGLFGLQVLLMSLTAITLGILAHRLQLTLRKSLVLVALYFVFIGYAVLGSLGI